VVSWYNLSKHTTLTIPKIRFATGIKNIGLICNISIIFSERDLFIFLNLYPSLFRFLSAALKQVNNSGIYFILHFMICQ